MAPTTTTPAFRDLVFQGISACTTSLAARENAVDLTDEEWAYLDGIYAALQGIKARVVSRTPLDPRLGALLKQLGDLYDVLLDESASRLNAPKPATEK